MKTAGANIEELITLRKYIHKNAEGKYLEEKTSTAVVEHLKKYGLDESCIRTKIAVTGLEVNI